MRRQGTSYISHVHKYHCTKITIQCPIIFVLVTKIEDTLLCNRNFSNDDNIMKDIETMSGHEIIFLEHQPNKQNGDELLESVNSGTSTNSNDITNFDDGNTSYYMTETIPSNMDSDEVN